MCSARRSRATMRMPTTAITASGSIRRSASAWTGCCSHRRAAGHSMPTSSRQRIGARTVAKFDVTAGMITDHLPALEYVLRDKAQRGEKIKAALLLIDVDSFGKPPATNVNIDSFLPPELSGEHPARFWWRYLTVFQLRMWRGIIALPDARRRSGRKRTLADGRAPLGIGRFRPARNDRAARSASAAADEVPGARLLVATRPNLAAHLAMVARFAALCRDNGIELTVATTPMRADAASLLRSGRSARRRGAAERGRADLGFHRAAWLAADIALLGRPIAFQASSCRDDAGADVRIEPARTISASCAAQTIGPNALIRPFPAATRGCGLAADFA